jgi:hypothetical protein
MAKKCEHDRIRRTCSVCSPEQVYAAYKYKALKQRKLVFTLTLDEFEKIVQSRCVFCGEQQDPRGVDRKDNRVGYTPNNSQACCWPCNYLKRGLVQESFLSTVQKIAAHQQKLREQKQTPEQKPEPIQAKPVAAVPIVPMMNWPRSDSHLDPQARAFLDGKVL